MNSFFSNILSYKTVTTTTVIPVSKQKTSMFFNILNTQISDSEIHFLIGGK